MLKLRALPVTLMLGLVAAGSNAALAQKRFEVETGKAFDSAVPKDFYLEGNAIPTEKRNAVLLRTPTAERVVVALIDTSGYSSQIQAKYTGMLITEGAISVCGQSLGVGSYGFGWESTRSPSGSEARLAVYDQAGHKAIACSARKDSSHPQPRPLQVIPGQDQSARLYLGRYWVDLR